MNPEDLIDWSTIPGTEWYRPQNVPKAIAGIRACDPTAPDILYQVANNHAGELYPAAVAATPILLDIALQSENHKAAMEALSALENLIWFRGEPPFDTVVQEGLGGISRQGNSAADRSFPYATYGIGQPRPKTTQYCACVARISWRARHVMARYHKRGEKVSGTNGT